MAPTRAPRGAPRPSTTPGGRAGRGARLWRRRRSHHRRLRPEQQRQVRHHVLPSRVQRGEPAALRRAHAAAAARRWRRGVSERHRGVPHATCRRAPSRRRHWPPRPSRRHRRDDLRHGGVNPGLLVAGTNVLAVEIHQANATSSDISFNLELAASAGHRSRAGRTLQIGTPSSTVVRWRTSAPVISRVHYGPSAGAPRRGPPRTADRDHRARGRAHRPLPNTTYYYTVGTDRRCSPAATPRTSSSRPPVAGTAKPTRVWVLGDSGTANANARAVRDAYYAFTGTRRTNLWLMLGDNAYSERHRRRVPGRRVRHVSRRCCARRCCGRRSATTTASAPTRRRRPARTTTCSRCRRPAKPAASRRAPRRTTPSTTRTSISSASSRSRPNRSAAGRC